ncbi:sulfite exporter TauE/SafE family protein [Motiliproteus sp. SC1-56]|uniref:sulfite exporter TauE/SafE family protein n=1 Tax=Motiliproteus sp. SC1-56 TaxID=2799565 RepID=UPI001A8E750D|nr:sulfite exporter TauE/SafE family protein [Motiliproteus sp. SC1-56]
MDWITWLLPPDLAPAQTLLLLAASFVTATMTAVLGVGGGVLLLAVIASILPPVAIIPVHGLVQAGANGHRTLLTRQHVDRRLFTDFLLGATLGAALASLVVVQLPVAAIQLSIALFVLYLTWGPRLQSKHLTGWRFRLAAALTTLTSMFVGASGPLVAAFAKQASDDRHRRIANFSACMSVQHGFKLLVFGWLGFAFADWLGLVLMMIASGLAGTWIGLHLLAKMSNRLFDRGFKLVLTLLAVRLLYSALTSLAG